MFRLIDLILVTLTVLFLAILVGVIGPTLDDQPDSDQQQAQRDYRRDVAAAQLCRSEHGDASFVWSVDGELVCIPRNGKRVLAGNP